MEIPPNLRLVRRMREGGMGAVWLAENRALSTNVVVKFLGAEHAKDENAIRRFRNEAASAAQVKSPHVVQIFDHGVTKDGIPYIVMELLEGHDLAEHILRRGPMPPQIAAHMIAQIARALTKAHERGIIHRDIKPENIFLTDAGGNEVFAKLLDFGIARAPELKAAPSTDKESILGTPNYMSPEQMQGHPLDPRTDLWSLGLCAFEALTGTRAFPQTILSQLALAVCHAPLPVPTDANPDIPAAIDVWFAKACARDPKDRYQNARELADGLLEATSFDASVSGPFKPMKLDLPHTTPESLAEPRQRISKDDLMTRYAREATDLSVEFIKSLGGVRIGEFVAELAAPEQPSTSAGAHAVQQIRLISKRQGASSIKAGSVDVKGNVAELRSYDHLVALHQKRKMELPIDRDAYEAFLDRAEKFLTDSKIAVERVRPSVTPPPPAGRQPPWIAIAIAAVFLVSLAIFLLRAH
jgi:serine/threonine protein kinase